MYLSYIINCLRRILFDSTVNAATSYYPEVGKRKNKISIMLEQFMHFVKFHSINEFYFLYGFDRTGYREEADYVDYRRFQRRRDALNRVSAADSHILVLRDKFIFGLVAGALGVRTPQNIGLLKKKELCLLGHSTHTLSLSLII